MIAVVATLSFFYNGPAQYKHSIYGMAGLPQTIETIKENEQKLKHHIPYKVKV